MKYINIILGAISLLIYPLLVVLYNLGIYTPDSWFYIVLFSLFVISFCLVLNILIYSYTGSNLDRYILAGTIYLFCIIILINVGMMLFNYYT